MKKAQVLEVLGNLPDEFSTEELIERLIFLEKINQGKADIAEGKVITLSDVKAYFEGKWNKSR